jgi:hypothetical protein
MPIFIVRTWEQVEGTYEVQAASEGEARSFFETPKTIVKAMDAEKMDQLDYMSFEIDIRNIDQLSF